MKGGTKKPRQRARADRFPLIEKAIGKRTKAELTESVMKMAKKHATVARELTDQLAGAARSGNPINDGVRMARTTLMAMLGRMAAYTGQELTWEQALNSQQKLVPEELDWHMEIQEIPQSIPGLTEFI